MTNNLPEPDDAPWLNLTPQEVEELRYNKQELTKYGKEKIRALMNKTGEEGGGRDWGNRVIIIEERERAIDT